LQKKKKNHEKKTTRKKRCICNNTYYLVAEIVTHTPFHHYNKAKWQKKKHVGNKEKLWTLLTTMANDERQISRTNHKGHGGGKRM